MSVSVSGGGGEAEWDPNIWGMGSGLGTVTFRATSLTLTVSESHHAYHRLGVFLSDGDQICLSCAEVTVSAKTKNTASQPYLPTPSRMQELTVDHVNRRHHFLFSPPSP